MSKYYESYNKGKGRRERIGFYAAFVICLAAIIMAVYSTYNTVTGNNLKSLKAESPTAALEVNQPVYGVTAPKPEEPTIGDNLGRKSEDEEASRLEEITEASEPMTEPASEASRPDALETMLSVDLSLQYPTKDGKVTREYSKDSVYFKTLNVWKPHTGVDFEGELGDPVYAMAGGEVTSVRDDKMFGKTVEISVNNIVCIYSGLGSVGVKKGDSIEPKQEIGTVGVVPFEANDKNHIHVSVKANGTFVDPLTFTGGDE